MITVLKRAWVASAAVLALARAGAIQAQPPALATECAPPTTVPACRALHGDRAEGWMLQGRSEVMARHGMVVTSQPLAAQAGLDTLRRGGNAIDAAVATAAALAVVEPMMTGVGGDLFAMVYVAREHKVYVLNASGTAPSGATPERLHQLGYSAGASSWGPGAGMPTYGILPVTVPGAVWGWEELLRRFGKLHLKEDLEPAVEYAQEGFPVSERVAHDWQLPAALPLRECCHALDPDSVRTWYPGGQPPVAGEIFANPDLARTLRLLQQHGRQAFYRGEIAHAILRKSAALGGTMTAADLANYHGEWVEPAVSSYHGLRILELPPPSQAWAAEEILNLLSECVSGWTGGRTLADLGPRDPLYWHLLVEAKKLAYADLLAYNADPDAVSVPLARLLAPEHAASLCERVDPRHASAVRHGAAAEIGDTIVLSTADAEGNMVSWVNSNYAEFGSGITVPGYGFVLHDRGALFSLEPRSPNLIAPGKRPFNTLSAGFVMQGAQPLMTVTLMGGDEQAQGHAQLLVNILELGANAQAATEMARFHHIQVSNVLQLESALYHEVGAALGGMGHQVQSADATQMGGAQIIVRLPAPAGSGPLPFIYRAGSDSRKDGQAAGW